MLIFDVFFILMIRRPPRSTRTDTLLPYTTLFRSKKVELYFGDIPPGPPLEHQGPWIAKMKGVKRVTIQDRVPQARLYAVWNIPGFCDPAANQLSLAAAVLGNGKNSPLYGSEERRVGKECVRQGRTGWAPNDVKKKLKKNQPHP